MKSRPVKTTALIIFLGVFFGLGVLKVEAANLLMTPNSGEYAVGETFSINVYVDSRDELMNAASASIAFPTDLVEVTSVTRNSSIISYWVLGPEFSNSTGEVYFEGVVSNPGFDGSYGQLVTIRFRAKKEGNASLVFQEGSVLANDGLGTNIIKSFNQVDLRFRHRERPTVVEKQPEPEVQNKVAPTTEATDDDPEPEVEQDQGVLGERPALPVIVDYSPQIEKDQKIFISGQGQPGATTKIIFQNIREKSIGERIVESFDNKKKELDEVLIKNDEDGFFRYVSPENLVAGVYNTTPFFIDEKTNTESPGLGVQIFVSENQVLKVLSTIINALVLIIPIVFLGTVIYFIPWYFARKLKVMRGRMELEEAELKAQKKSLKAKKEVKKKRRKV